MKVFFLVGLCIGIIKIIKKEKKSVLHNFSKLKLVRVQHTELTTQTVKYFACGIGFCPVFFCVFG